MAEALLLVERIMEVIGFCLKSSMYVYHILLLPFLYQPVLTHLCSLKQPSDGRLGQEWRGMMPPLSLESKPQKGSDEMKKHWYLPSAAQAVGKTQKDSAYLF